MQHAPTHTHSQTRHHAARRAAWLGLGLVAAAFAVFDVAKHGQGTLVLALSFALAPDLAMLIGAKRTLARGQLAPAAVPFYNAVHRLWGPLALLACTVWIDSAALFTGGLAWLAHVAIDRAAGFGLRGPRGFQHG